MVILAKCAKCQQFSKPADDEYDKYCSRCKKALEQGLSEMPDKKPTTQKSKNEDSSDEGKLKQGNSN